MTSIINNCYYYICYNNTLVVTLHTLHWFL